MKKITVDDITISLPSTLGKILLSIDANSLGIIFLIDENYKILGVISDGDARRLILKGTSLEEEITQDSHLFNIKPKVLSINSNSDEIFKLLEMGLKCIPLIDDSGKIIDFSTKNRIRNYPVAEPSIGSQEIANLLECASSGWISSQGKFIDEFEKKFSEFLGGGYSVAVSNGTVALQLALATFDIGLNDEVIIPDYTFAATANAVLHVGAKPILVDVELDTWCISPEEAKNKINLSTKAILPVHLYGQPAKIDELVEIARSNNLILIEDCAEALYAYYKGRLVGLDGDCSCFSFFANKMITTGEGGMLVFKDKKMADKAKILRDHGMTASKRYWHLFAGYNFRMTNMQAAVGVAQLSRIEEFNDKRTKLFHAYNEVLNSSTDLSSLPVNDWSINSRWLYTILLNGFGESFRNNLMEGLARDKISSRPGFYPLHIMPPYKETKGIYKNSSYLAENSISLPTSVNMSPQEAEFIAKTLLENISRLKNS